jgi:hypothetical protein
LRKGEFPLSQTYDYTQIFQLKNLLKNKENYMVLRFWIGFKHLFHPLNPPPAGEMALLMQIERYYRKYLKIIKSLEICTVPRWRGIKGVDKKLSGKN